MTPALSIATDNFYKFKCLFGVALIFTAIIAFVSSAASTLDRQARLAEREVHLVHKANPTKEDNALLAQTNELREIFDRTMFAAANLLGLVFIAGMGLSLWGAIEWKRELQDHADKMAKFQLDKVQVEIEKLRLECAVLQATTRRPAP